MKNEQCISQEKIENAKKQLQELQETANIKPRNKKAAIVSIAEHIKKARTAGRSWKEISESLNSAGIIVSPVYIRQVIESEPAKAKGKAKARQAAPPSPVSVSSPSPASPASESENGRNTPKPDRVFAQRGNV